MNLRQALELVVLASLWGASFLFMRIGAPEMGPVGLIAIRTLVAGLFLLPFLFFYNSHRGVRRHLPAIALVGLAVDGALSRSLFRLQALPVARSGTALEMPWDTRILEAIHRLRIRRPHLTVDQDKLEQALMGEPETLYEHAFVERDL